MSSPNVETEDIFVRIVSPIDQMQFSSLNFLKASVKSLCRAAAVTLTIVTKIVRKQSHKTVKPVFHSCELHAN